MKDAFFSWLPELGIRPKGSSGLAPLQLRCTLVQAHATYTQEALSCLADVGALDPVLAELRGFNGDSSFVCASLLMLGAAAGFAERGLGGVDAERAPWPSLFKLERGVTLCDLAELGAKGGVRDAERVLRALLMLCRGVTFDDLAEFGTIGGVLDGERVSGGVRDGDLVLWSLGHGVLLNTSTGADEKVGVPAAPKCSGIQPFITASFCLLPVKLTSGHNSSCGFKDGWTCRSPNCSGGNGTS